MPTLLAKIRRRLDGLPLTPRELERSLTVLSSLRYLGWQESIRRGPVDASGDPLPWITYPAIDWIAKRLGPEHQVFEYGSGHSTLWYARHVSRVVAVEDDPAWIERLRPSLPPNATVMHRPDPDSYAKAIEDHEPASFDVIGIDGAARNRCARAAPPFLKSTGFIVFDNSDRPEYAEGVRHLMDLGYQRIDFVGFIPEFGHVSCTSIFFQDAALLKLKDPPPFLGY